MLLLFQSAVSSVTEFSVNGEIRNFAVGNGKVFVVTDSQLLQMKLDLVEEKHKDIQNHTHQNQVNILLPFDANKTLITCGTSDCGYCELLDINDISRSVYREKVTVSPSVNKSSVSFIVDFDEGNTETEKYMLVAREKVPEKCVSDEGVSLHNILESQQGGIFSKSGIDPTEASISPQSDVEETEWIDGFQSSPPSHSYLLVNVKSGTGPAVVVLRMKNSRSKTEMTRSLQGIFTAQEPNDPQKTALAIYDLSQIRDRVPSYFSCTPPCRAQKGEDVLRPHTVVLKHSSMSSVAAEKKGSWIELYIGTANGQLMKIVLDKALNSGCVTVLYKSIDDRMVFPRMHVDPVDHKYIYIASKNQIRRVAVFQCGVYSTLTDCRASQDPSCGWCVTTNKCSTKVGCSDSIWIPIPEYFFQKELITFQVAKVSGKVDLSLYLIAQGTVGSPLKCSIKAGNVDLCDNLTLVSPNSCSCSFSRQRLPPEGLRVIATVTIGDQKITESLKLRSCPNITETSPYAACAVCVSAGCHWSPVSQNCSWTQGSAPQVHIQPEIISVLPNQVSLYGRNNAIIKGKNLDPVMKIRLQRLKDCEFKELKETPVLERSTDTLRFSIPSGNKGTVRVCVVTPDGHCHSKATITYGAQPTCTGLQPRNTWASGGRKIEVLGSSLEYVETIIVNDKEISVKSSTVGVWFHTPPLRVGEGSGPFSVSLRVGNSTVDCVYKLSYLPNPEFISFSTSQDVSYGLVFINKKQGRLNMRVEDVKVWGLQEEKQFECVVEKVISTAIVCNILETQEVRINVTSLRISVGDFSTILKTQVGHTDSLFCV
ncbi:hypothetical protein MHYP_G00172120 [Metynnis hypsauchen]